IDVNLRENEIKTKVRTVFFEILNLDLKIKMLQKMDSIYKLALTKSELRFKVGESNLLELKTIELQRGSLNIQLMNALRDLQVMKYQFQFLINTQNTYNPDHSILKLSFNDLKDTTLLNQHPMILRIVQQEKLYQSQLHLSKQKLLPNLMLGFRDMSMLGMGANEVNYDTRSSRFRSIQVGVGLPLFFGSHKAEIEAQKLQLKINQHDYQNQLQQMQTNLSQLTEKYLNQLNIISYYETQALQNADTMLQSANAQYNNGAINYIEWMMLTHQTINVQQQYIDALLQLNELSIQLYNLNNL
ncbi:MAG: TolC family protein, partial [Candidatus Paceibacterota bacterium]